MGGRESRSFDRTAEEISVSHAAGSQSGSIVGVLLAAGLGTRYDPSGECLKLLQPMQDGTRAGIHAGLPIVVAAARNLKAGAQRTLAVVRPRDDPHQLQLRDLLRREGCELVICERATDGMGASLACGINAGANAFAWIVALGDMPAIEAATINAVADALRAGHATVAPTYRRQRGHPVGFSARCLNALLQCDGEHGARAVLAKYPPHLIAVDDAGILIDIDHR